MIKLSNVSKFYHSNGTIATGFSKVNVEFNMGEFVVITGESGSGKSTLLNVISGLDTYEEGEMYINGLETSHYTEKDFEAYRRKYIGNIFQNFNLVSSYTVYQNIELVMLLNGYKKKEIKEKVDHLIEQVKLTEYRNTKVSKLSGGQKQRVAIARALAKETPIIIADEPTGNLDVQAAKDVFEILSEISKDKLVIIVTHNYEQVEQYATRKIRMHDGRLIEDLQLKPKSEVVEEEVKNYKQLSFLNTIKLGWRNTFNIFPKFALLLAVFLFISLALVSEYSSFKQSEYQSQFAGYNYFFSNVSSNRIVIKKTDGTSISESDFEAINQLDNIESVIKADLSLDSTLEFTNNDWSEDTEDMMYYDAYGTIYPISMLEESNLTDGSITDDPYGIVIEWNPETYWDMLDDTVLGQTLYNWDNNTGELDKSKPYTVTGYILSDDENLYVANIYVNDSIYNTLLYSYNQNYSKMKLSYNGRISSCALNAYDGDYCIVEADFVPAGTVYLPASFNQLSPNKKAIGQSLEITVGNIYYTDTVGLVVNQTYDENNCQKLLGIKKEQLDYSKIYMNQSDIDRLFNKETYQSSILVKDLHTIDTTTKELQDLGFTTLVMKDSLYNYDVTSEVLSILRTIVTIILVIVLFLISYFVVRIIFRSRNVYFTIIRLLGGSRNVARNLLIMEMIIVACVAELLLVGAIYGQIHGYYSISLLATAVEFLGTQDYLVLFILPVLLAVLIGLRYANRLFVKSVMVTMKEEQ